MGLLLLLEGDEESVDVGEDTTSGDRGVGEQSVQLIVVADGQLDVSWDNAGLLVVLSGVASELEDLSSEVLKDGSEVHGGTCTNALSIAAVLEETGDSADWELETSLAGSGNWASCARLAFASATFACHLETFFV